MFKSFLIVALSTACLYAGTAHAAFASSLCDDPEYQCFKAKRGQSWESLFPDEAEREIVRKINRVNIALSPGMVVAVPIDLGNIDLLSLAPFEPKIEAEGNKQIRVDLEELAWGAYDEQGELVKWGPISGGKGYCEDTDSRCGTVTGEFVVQRKQGEGCVSGKFPLPDGGAPMPFCMHFYGGYALHGSATVPGYHASHGCVRLFVDDAQWLNEDFVDVGKTKVIIRR